MLVIAPIEGNGRIKSLLLTIFHMWLGHILFFILSASESFLTDHYILTFRGYSPQPNDLPIIYGVIEPIGNNSRSAEFSLDGIRLGECYKNLCFAGFSDDGKNIVIAYKSHNQWNWGLIPLNRLGSQFNIDMDAIPGTRQALKSALDEWHLLFPENNMPTLFRNLGYGLLQDDEFASFNYDSFSANSSELTSDIPAPRISEMIQYLLSNYEITQKNGVTTIATPIDDCEKFKSELTNASPDALDAAAFAYKLKVYCKLPHDIGVCDPDTFNSKTKVAECRPFESIDEPLNECGGSFNGNLNEALRFQSNSRNGKSCRLEKIDLFLSIYGGANNSDKLSSIFSFSFPIKVDPPEQGICFRGNCVGLESKMCKMIDPTIALSMFEEDLEKIFGLEILDYIRTSSDDQPGPDTTASNFPQLKKFFENSLNRKKFSIFRSYPRTENPWDSPSKDNSVCPGGLCKNGECIPFEKLLYGNSSGGDSCRSLENGNPCNIFNESSSGAGVCYQSECYLCDFNNPQKLVDGPQCPNNPAFPGIAGWRKNCYKPDVCSYL